MENKYTIKLEKMREHLAQCNSSDKTVTEYCKSHGLSIATYYYWHKKLNTPSTSGGFIELPATNTNSRIEVVLPNGIQIHFDQLVPSAYLKELVCYI